MSTDVVSRPAFDRDEPALVEPGQLGPPVVPPQEDRGTLLDLLDRNAVSHGDLPAVVDGDRGWTWAEYRRDAEWLAAGLVSLGVQPGDRVGIMLPNRAEHPLVDTAALMVGAVPTSFYATLAPDQLAYVAADAANTVAVVASEHLPIWLELRPSLPRLRHLVVVDDLADARGDDPSVLSWVDLLEDGRTASDDTLGEVARRSEAVRPDDPATIVYTSGTTGHPKGTLITHRGVRFVMDAVSDRVHAADPEGRFAPFVRDGRVAIPAGMAAVSYLPLAHMAERLFTHYLGLRNAMTVHYCRDFAALRDELARVRPHVFLAVPRVWEKMHDGISQAVATAPGAWRRRLGGAALRVARDRGEALVTGQPLPVRQRVAAALFERLLYPRLLRAIGLDRCLLAVSGAAPVTVDLLAFYTGLGLPIVEGYGMTESSAVISLNDLDRPRVGTVGIPLDGVEVQVDQDTGEILARGPNVTPGYLNRPEATAEAVDQDGWLHTGDVGEFDDGHLRITGRIKELIINAAGKNMSPANIEMAISTASPIIGPVCVVGDRRPYLVALVTLDPDALGDWAAARGIEAADVSTAVASPDVRAEVEAAVVRGNARLSRVEQVKRWELLDHAWTVTDGVITPSLKLRRQVVHERYADEIERLYEA